MVKDADAVNLIQKGVRRGVYDVVMIVSVAMLAAYFGTGLITPYDSTDGPSGRSGLVIFTDCKTGLEYLSAGQGGLTPRLSVDGSQMRESCK